MVGFSLVVDVQNVLPTFRGLKTVKIAQNATVLWNSDFICEEVDSLVYNDDC
jgi:hypothetical protein